MYKKKILFIKQQENLYEIGICEINLTKMCKKFINKSDKILSKNIKEDLNK